MVDNNRTRRVADGVSARDLYSKEQRNPSEKKFQHFTSNLSLWDFIPMVLDGKTKSVRVQEAIALDAKQATKLFHSKKNKYGIIKSLYKNNLMPALKEQDPEFYDKLHKRQVKKWAKKNVLQKLRDNPELRGRSSEHPYAIDSQTGVRAKKSYRTNK